MHSYDLASHPKVKIIVFITVVSVYISIYLNQAIVFLENITNKTLSITFSYFVVFNALYFLFTKYIWKIKLFKRVFNFPDLNGKYLIVGNSIKKSTNEKFDWEGVLSIKQDWDKILVSMKSKNSSSESISINGSVVYHPMKGYELTYSYDNTPSNNIDELHKHIGTCTLNFDEETETATGNYYNDIKNRENYGSMDLRRINE